MNKKGSIGYILLFFVVIAVLISLGLFLVIGITSIDFVFDTITPEVASIGMVGSSNFTEISSYSIEPFDDFVQKFSWFGGVIYMIILIALFGFAISFKVTANKVYMILFFLLAFLMIIVSIFVSNIYQDLYQGSDDIATRMQEQSLMSYLVLHGPMIFTIIIFISGAIVFSGLQAEEFI